jgi:hypothetical protein
MSRTSLFAVLAAAAFAAVSPALAGDSDDNIVVIARGEPTMVDPVVHAQLIAHAGLTAAEATGLTFHDLLISSFNAGADGDDLQAIGVQRRGQATAGAQLAAAAGLSPEVARSLGFEQVVMIKFDRDASSSDR